MIQLGDQIRLTADEVECMTYITGFSPAGIKTLDDLSSYIERCKRHYWGNAKEGKYLDWLIDRALSRNSGGA